MRSSSNQRDGSIMATCRRRCHSRSLHIHYRYGHWLSRPPAPLARPLAIVFIIIPPPGRSGRAGWAAATALARRLISGWRRRLTLEAERGASDVQHTLIRSECASERAGNGVLPSRPTDRLCRQLVSWCCCSANNAI